MNKNNYKECHKVADLDNVWLQYYDEVSAEDKQTKAEDEKYENLGYMYTKNSNWYYQWNRDEKCYYVVVDKEDEL